MDQIPPAEWSRQARIFTAFPSHPILWVEDLAPARVEVAAMVRQLLASVPVTLLAEGTEALAAARAACPGADVADVAFGDIWLRDTAPIFTSHDHGVWFHFNGWGGKYDLPGDDSVGGEVAALAGATVARFDFILEGGAIDGDGQGLLLTTEQCLLNPNRNAGWDRKTAEAALGEALGTRRVVWLGDGLLNDHTDGHVDNLARFVAPGTVALPVSAGADDPNAAMFDDARKRLRSAGLAVVDMPSVGRLMADDEVVPASYMNFVIANGQVIVPVYGAANDDAAAAALRRIFPRHRITALPANAILTGGGSFHCITQQLPEV